MKPFFCILLTACLLFAPLSFAQVTPTPAPPASVLALGGTLMLVNNEKKISKTYAPEDLVLPRVAMRKASLQENIFLRPQAAAALERMFDAAKFEAGHTLYAASGYRSFGIQQLLFNQKVEEVGSRASAMRRVAPAGASEHQLGLAMDVQSPSQLNLNASFGQTPEGVWVGENAHRFGFIVRYKAQWSDVTGIVSEPWHIRYVGVAHATALYQLDIPLEAYVEQARKLPEYVLAGASHPLLVALIGALAKDEEPEALASLLSAEEEQRYDTLRSATIPFLGESETYEQVLWYAYPTPRPTPAPWVDNDEEFTLSPAGGG